MRGLSFRVTAAGARSWCFRFRDPHTGHSTRIGLGPYPAVSLSAAREMAESQRKIVATGKNPVEVRRQQRIEAPEKTFEALALRYMREHAERKKRPKSVEEDRRNLNLHVLPQWGNRRFEDLRRNDLIGLVEGLIKDGKPILANRIHALCSKIGSFAVEVDFVETGNPFAGIKKRVEENIGRRILSDDEIRLFWSNIVLPPVSRRVGLALRLALLTGVRSAEVAGMRRAELEYIDKPEIAAWTISDIRVKNKRAHYVPLSPLALETIKSAMELTGDSEPLVFPSRSKEDAVTANAFGVAMRRFADQLKPSSPAAKSWRADPPSPHDLRRTFATKISALGILKEDRDACMNHVRSDVGSKHYDLYDRAKEKRIALNLWADTLASIIAADGHKAAR